MTGAILGGAASLLSTIFGSSGSSSTNGSTNASNSSTGSSSTNTSGSTSNSGSSVGINTGSNSNTGTSSSSGSTTGSSSTSSSQDTSENQSTTGVTDVTGVTQNSGVTSNTADAGALASAKGAAATATYDADNASSQTSDLVNSIITQAANKFAPSAGLARGAGLYSSTTQGMLQDYAVSQATSDAAAGVLNYQATEQQIAEGANKDVIGATGTTTSNNTQTTNQQTTSQQLSSLVQSILGNTSGTTSGTSNNTGTSTSDGTSNSTNVNFSQSLQNILQSVSGLFNNSGTSKSDTTGATNSSSGLGSIVCTQLMKEGKISKEDWKVSSLRFMKYSQRSRNAYYGIAEPMRQVLVKSPGSWKAKMVSYLFIKRTSWCVGKSKSPVALACHLMVLFMVLLSGLAQLVVGSEGVTGVTSNAD